jgi:serine/threonine-protein kinase
MELLEGETLGDRLKRVGPMSPSEAVSIARHIAGVLGATHSHNIVHRDLKPDNVYLVPDPALPRGERAKILDFGIAKLATDERPSKVRTETGRLMGTPYYMSPEQCRGSGQVDHRSDIYSLGCVLYQMLTGRPPFVLEGSGEVLAAHIHVPPLPPRSIVTTIPPVIEAVVMRLLAKDPDQRFQTMDEVIFALNQAVPRSSELVDTEPSLQATSTSLPITSQGSGTPSQFRHPSYAGPTTLGSSASESLATIPGQRRSSSWMAYVALLTVAAAASFFIFRAVLLGGENDSASQSAGSAAVAASGDTVTDDKAGEPDKRPVVKAIESRPTMVTLTIESDPDGAKVYRESDGVRIGTTPVHYKVRRGTGEMGFIVKRRGYRSQELSMGVDRNDAFMVKLRRGRAGESDTPEKVSKPSASAADAEKERAKAATSSSDKPGGDSSGSGRGSAVTTKEPKDRDAPIDPFKFAPQ